ncbi:hypothetical protein OG875_03975 [Streptomyces sp. NBC_01498]|uniref:hypothetical protein n=1 Tax=Streptomyces sp. NBC_01498 TaxID=2975870 RepID=UPI002E7B1DC4|nr:hypothetical protein [Streptomyces sp. NBC_01498]WTL23825.1 hypothetical protein OG875_03975 [Streptomyces sp. NBC_01498]
MTVPHQAKSPEDTAKPPEDHRHMVRRRWLTAIVIVLLIGVPAGYLVISAGQSRRSGLDKELESSATGLTDAVPSRMKQRVFEVPIPARATNVRYYETSNWKSSRLYVQFTVTSGRLDTFLTELGTHRDALKEGNVTIAPRDSRTVGWDFVPTRVWSGITHRQKDPLPTQDITVDLSDPAMPRVYLVSTTTP